MKLPLTLTIDMFERLPVPFGLVRYGVAPDHPKLKQPTLVYDKIARSAGFAFLGNVAVGRDVTLEEVRSTHHAILFACGAELDKRLGLANEDLPGSRTATEFVGWYNGHPEYRDRSFDLSGDVVAIIGQGNVALDVARILAKPVEELRSTDIAAHALDVLAESRIKEIHIIGRRGPAQANFTTKELRELGELKGYSTEINAQDLLLNPASQIELENKTNFSAAGNVEVFRSWTARVPAAGSKRIVFHFLQSPVALHGHERLDHLTLEQTELVGPAFGQTCRGTGLTSILKCNLLFRSIGYRGRPLPGVPFDEAKGVIPNIAGRIGEDRGLYAAGWIKRGPSGIIGTNRADAVATVQSIAADLDSLDPRPKPGASPLRPLLASRGKRIVGYEDWLRIDAVERSRGESKGKPREKLIHINEMLSLLES